MKGLWDIRGNLSEEKGGVEVPRGKWLVPCLLVAVTVLIAFLHPLLGLGCAVIAAWALARRIGARQGVAVPASVWLTSGGSTHLGALAVCASLPWMWAVSDSDFVKKFASLGILVGLVLVGVRAAQWTNLKVESVARYYRWTLDLAPVFGVAPAAFDDGEFSYNGEGVIVNPVPPAVSARFERNAFDAALATVHPHLEVAEESTSTRIVIQTASSETHQRRKALAASGGLFAGVVVPAASAPHSLVPTTEGQTPLVISLEDL